MRDLLIRFARRVCGWCRHDDELVLDGDRIFLRCCSCGWVSNGIAVPNAFKTFRRKLVA